MIINLALCQTANNEKPKKKKKITNYGEQKTAKKKFVVLYFGHRQYKNPCEIIGMRLRIFERKKKLFKKREIVYVCFAADFH